LTSTAAIRSTLQQIRAERQRRELDRVRAEADQIRARCQTLAGFVREAWRVLEPRAKYIHGWHIDAICKALEAVTHGDINRLLINVPPGAMKSLLTSVFWPAWEWGPMGLRSMRYLNTAYNDGPVTRDSIKFRNLVLSEWYRTLWPEVVLTRRGETSMENTDTGTREGSPFGSLTAKRADRLIIDDPHSTETAESDAERETTTRKFREGALDRLNDQERSAIVVIMQRLHQRDISGVIIEEMPEQGFVHLLIPMRFETERKCVIRLGEPPREDEDDQRPVFWQDPRAQEGELMAPERWPPQAADKLEIGKGPYAWAGQYQQRPAPREGGMFKVDAIGKADFVPLGAVRVRGWDIAGSTRKTSPYTVGAKLAYIDGIVYIEHVARERAEIDQAEKLIVDTAKADKIGVKQSIPQDPASAGKSQKFHLARRLQGLDFVFSREEMDKTDRAIPFASMVNAGSVRMVIGPWNAALEDEMRNFPASAFKDQIDALSRAYAELIKHIDLDAEFGLPIILEPADIGLV
jgi:predicted phage terminase large subunit-like protein